MSTQLVKKEILRFLAESRPEVLCISGKWGVGKTFSWKRYLSEASKVPNGIGLGRYAYVSLFGINSLEELKYSLFEHTVPKDKITQDASLETINDLLSSAEGFGRRYAWLLNALPGVKTYTSSLGPALFLLVKDQIVCIDDLERKGDKLDTGDVLGLISFLKEERRCKVVLLLNDEALEREAQDKFNKYLEKVVDESIKFAPSAKECVEIALPGGDNVSRLVSASCVDLNISNIRVIKKIERFVKSIEGILGRFDRLVTVQAARSLTLLGWVVYQPDAAPTIEHLLKRKQTLFASQPGQVAEKEAAWNAMLDSYGFAYMNELDLALLDGVKNGFFDQNTIVQTAAVLEREIKAQRSGASFEKAWRLYHDSFKDNQNEVLDVMYKNALADAQNITPSNLNGTVVLLKELGRGEQAAEVLRHYIRERGQDRKLFDLSQDPFRADITDPDVVRAFEEKLATSPDDRTVASVLDQIAENKSWTEGDVAFLSRAAVDDYYRLFREKEGRELSRMIDVCLQFDQITNASNVMMEVSRCAREALTRIGRESPINARRVRKYGINIESPPLDSSSRAAQEPQPRAR